MWTKWNRFNNNLSYIPENKLVWFFYEGSGSLKLEMRKVTGNEWKWVVLKHIQTGLTYIKHSSFNIYFKYDNDIMNINLKLEYVV